MTGFSLFDQVLDRKENTGKAENSSKCTHTLVLSFPNKSTGNPHNSSYIFGQKI